ncbi:metallophosphatase [Aureimonas sp. SA4125]|uniref:metallophosphoesterase family protein n=1 Tax=Aureimonas sp. SA4125 TaxID=2826993 RepID=UPI001CC4AB5F|nr:DNA repair exonuclease [Aureimonas sp. SA4125]BDA83768.1 metallophosphatase [Aureimonas sp. SA4125]
MIRFLHTADWQIGKPFGGFDAEKRGELKGKRFETVGRLARLASERQCDAVLVAGDAFDDNTVSDREIRRTLEAMAAFAGPWVMLPGNHDAALSVSVWSRLRRLGLPGNVIVADAPEPILLAGGRMVVLPAPLVRRHEGADLTAWFDRAETPGAAIRVGLAHGSVANRLPEKAESGNPIADDRADRARLDYLALGDWHGFLEIAPRTFYSGTPEPDRYPANRPGHVAIVEIDAPGARPRVEAVAVAGFAWASRAVSLLGDAAELDDVLGAIERPGQTLVNVSLSGSLPLRGRVDLDDRLAFWGARFFDLRVNDAGLVDAPDEEDLDRIDVAGFVRTAIDRLRRKAADPADPERAAAALALRIAYVEHVRLAPAAPARPLAAPPATGSGGETGGTRSSAAQDAPATDAAASRPDGAAPDFSSAAPEPAPEDPGAGMAAPAGAG